jgi:hypothetical protein
MPTSELQCPFCEQTSSRPQGLAAHIRNRHPKQYPKWLKTPTRLTDAQKGSIPAKSAKHKELPAEPLAANVGQSVPAAAEVVATNPPLDLLKEARAQLTERKQSIEADLARMTDLTKELETVNTQIEALDKTLEVF